MVKQLVYESAALPPDLKCQVLSFLRVEWPDGFMGENRLRDWITKEADHPLILCWSSPVSFLAIPTSCGNIWNMPAYATKPVD